MHEVQHLHNNNDIGDKFIREKKTERERREEKKARDNGLIDL
jgi:hypothetical protein